MSFTDKMLPTLGTIWHTFTKKSDAMAFISWAKKYTKNWEYPCDAYLVEPLSGNPNEYSVKVTNW